MLIRRKFTVPVTVSSKISILQTKHYRKTFNSNDYTLHSLFHEVVAVGKDIKLRAFCGNI